MSEREVTGTRPTEDWKEALISANGTIGALVMGCPLKESRIGGPVTIHFQYDREGNDRLKNMKLAWKWDCETLVRKWLAA